MEIKNVRQIGKIENEMRVYEEDYVKSYIRQRTAGRENGKLYLVLVGRYIKNQEEENKLFIHGAIDVVPGMKDGKMVFDEQVWTEIYDKMKRYFPDGEIVGWCAAGNIEDGDINRIFKNTHTENFAGRDKVFVKFDVFEGEEEIYYCVNDELKPLGGYFVYYEKNVQMQEYMLDREQGIHETEKYDDRAVREFRDITRKRAAVKAEEEEARQLQLKNFYLAGAALVVMVAAVGVSALNSSRKVNGLEKTVADIRDSLMADDMKNDESIFDEPAYEVIKRQTGENSEDTDNKEIKSNDNLNSDTEEKTEDEKMSDTEGIIVEDNNPGNNGETDNRTGLGVDEHGKTNTEEENNNADNRITGNEQAENPGETQSDGNTENEEGIQSDENEEYTQSDEGEGYTQPDENNKNKEDTQQNGNAGEEVQSGESVTGTETDDKIADDTESGDNKTAVSSTELNNYEIYVVQKGDTLAGICYSIYGTINGMSELKELNGIVNEDRIYEGQELLYYAE